MPVNYVWKTVLEWMIHLRVFSSLQRVNFPHRVASLMRFREKRKERNFDKKIRYSVRKEVALRQVLVFFFKLWLGTPFVISQVPLSLFCWKSLNLIACCWKERICPLIRHSIPLETYYTCCSDVSSSSWEYVRILSPIHFPSYSD